jgi:hypothetical protein
MERVLQVTTIALMRVDLESMGGKLLAYEQYFQELEKAKKSRDEKVLADLLEVGSSESDDIARLLTRIRS